MSGAWTNGAPRAAASANCPDAAFPSMASNVPAIRARMIPTCQERIDRIMTEAVDLLQWRLAGLALAA
jgi:hypothetical protein